MTEQWKAAPEIGWPNTHGDVVSVSSLEQYHCWSELCHALSFWHAAACPQANSEQFSGAKHSNLVGSFNPSEKIGMIISNMANIEMFQTTNQFQYQHVHIGSSYGDGFPRSIQGAVEPWRWPQWFDKLERCTQRRRGGSIDNNQGWLVVVSIVVMETWIVTMW